MEEEMRGAVRAGKTERVMQREKGDCFTLCYTASSQRPLNASRKWGLTIVLFTFMKICMNRGHICLMTEYREELEKHLQTVEDSRNPAADFLMHVKFC